MGADDVGVALDDDDEACLADGVAGEVEAVEEGAFLEDGGFWGVDVFGGVVGEGAAGEADAFAGGVADGEHEAVAEAVAGAAFGDDDEAGAFEFFGAEAERAEVSLEVAVGAVGVADLECGGAFGGDAAGGDVVAGMVAGGVVEESAPPGEGGVVGFDEAALEAFAGGAFGIGGLQANAGAVGEEFECGAEVDVFAFLDPGENVAAV